MDELVIVEGKARLKERRASPQTITDEQIEAISLLKRHSETALSADRRQPDTDELAEVRERILEKLERMRERELGIETKARRQAIELIEWALGRAA